jgi:exopolysaccharide biosynthesis polyprenyl glycosylphosphotransferase
MLKRKEKFFAQIMVVCDLLALTLSYLGAYWIRRWLPSLEHVHVLPFGEYTWVLWVILPTFAFAFRRFSLYESKTYESPLKVFNSLTKAQLLGGLMLLSTMYLTRKIEVSRLVLQIFLALSFCLLLAEKICVKMLLDHLAWRRRRNLLWRVLLVGDKSHADKYLRLVRAHPHWGVEVVGIVSPKDIGGGMAGASNGRVSGGPKETESWADIFGNYVVDEVVAASAWEKTAGLKRLADICAERGVIFRMLATMPPARIGTYHIEDLGKDLGSGSYMLSLETVPQEFVPLTLKRLIDIAGALVGLILCGLVYPWYAWKLRSESPGPVLFKQKRGGQNARIFEIYKFRTMYMDAEDRRQSLLAQNSITGVMFKMKDDPRVTPTGHIMRKTHLDELPQFWNVLKGEMSLVGARPNPTVEVAHYSDHHYRRLSMKPGLTGIFQLNGHAKVDDFEETVKLDCEYIDNWSVWLDCKIIASTVVKMMRRDGW